MKSYDYDAMTFDGACYCIQCLPEGVTEEDADPIFADSEWDAYPVCDHCGAVHDYVGLTPHGIECEARNQDAEIFHEDFSNVDPGSWQAQLVEDNEGITEGLAGWYWWTCSPGCLPATSDPIGPFDTEQAAACDVIGV